MDLLVKTTSTFRPTVGVKFLDLIRYDTRMMGLRQPTVGVSGPRFLVKSLAEYSFLLNKHFLSRQILSPSGFYLV